MERATPALLALGLGFPSWDVPGSGLEVEPGVGAAQGFGILFTEGLPGVTLGLQR